MKAETELPRDRARPWKALLLVNSLLATVLGWGWFLVHEKQQEPPRSEAVRDTTRALELEELPPVPSLHSPVAVSRPSR